MRTLNCVMLVVPVLTLAACSNASGPAAGATLSLSFATLQQAGGAAGDRDPSTTTPTHTLVLSSARIVLDHIELVPASVTCPDADDNDVGNPDGNRTRVSAADEGNGQDRECEEIDQGPALVDLPVGQSVVTMFDVPVPAGTYASLEAHLQSAQANTAAGAAFDAAHPDLAGASVRVTGTFDGTPFIYTGRPHSHLEFRFDPPITVGSSGVNVTVHVSLDRWFQDPAGELVNPATANDGGPNADLVAENIRRSFRAFRDDQHRGDDGLGDGDGSANDHDGGDH